MITYVHSVKVIIIVSAKATYAAIAKTYAYLTPDLWKDMPLEKAPYAEFADYLAKNHRPLPLAGGHAEV